MYRLIIILLFLVSPTILHAQQRTIIELIKSTSLSSSTKDNVWYVRNPVFRHGITTLMCDSAVFYKERNYFEAFKNVHIIQGDTVNIYADNLTYDGNTKLAHLTNNVKMFTPTSTLTTQVLDYNTSTKIGKYLDGGKIVNPQATIVSKRGWYFANSRDAYFRYDVLVTTPQSTITSDTLQYNTFNNWVYFYGPTNIKGKDDKLYTENGAYNTQSENAMFGKNNLYTNGSRSLKGDSLYYYGKRGYGRAVKNISFVDTTDKMLLRGQLGEYYKATERIIVTQKAYIGMDTKDSATVKGKKMPDTLWLGADTLDAQKTMRKNLTIIARPTVVKDSDLAEQAKKAEEEKEREKQEAKKALAEEEKKNIPKVATPPTGPTKKLSKKEQRKLADSLKANQLIDTIKKTTDSLRQFKKTIFSDSLAKDSLTKSVQVKTPKDSLTVAKASKTAKPEITKPVAAIKKIATKLLDTVKPLNPADTIRIRVIKAYHNVRIYKSNMQAKADSLYFNAADSCLRWYKDPIMWGEGSQQTGDTIHAFFHDKKMHSFQVKNNGFLVNVEKDSTKFNQVKGKIITGFFSNGNLKNMFVDGNAESIYYTKKDNGEYDNMSQTLSSRIKFTFQKKELIGVSMYREIEGKVNPIDSLPKESLLTGFIWKPELRPISKADIIKGKSLKKALAPKVSDKKPLDKVDTTKKVIGQKTGNLPLNLEKATETIKKTLPRVKDSLQKTASTIDKTRLDSIKLKKLPDTGRLKQLIKLAEPLKKQ